MEKILRRLTVAEAADAFQIPIEDVKAKIESGEFRTEMLADTLTVLVFFDPATVSYTPAPPQQN